MANKPNNPALWSRAKSMARKKFDVYPSAYANGWAAKWYKSKGGTWRSAKYGAKISKSPAQQAAIAVSMKEKGIKPKSMSMGGRLKTAYMAKGGKVGGIPQRYKNMGFNKVGVKKKSNRPGKKWMVLAKKGDKYKVVHGGYKGMKDFTQHRNENRRAKFWSRMGGKNSAKAKDKFSPLYWHKRFGTW